MGLKISGRLVKVEPKTYKNEGKPDSNRVLIVIDEGHEVVLYANADDPRVKGWTDKVGQVVDLPVTVDTNGKSRLA